MTLTQMSPSALDTHTVPVGVEFGEDAALDSWPGLATTTDLVPPVSAPELPPVPRVLDDATTRQLRRWSNQLYKLLDTDFPPFGVREDCDRVAAELELREEQARNGSVSATRRDAFRDNPLNHRFELFQNGMLAGYVSYSMRAGVLRLHRTVVAATFEGAGMEGILIRKVLLAAHKRRLSALPYCSEVQMFLEQNPEYRSLIVG
ncbi:GNAT family N-acetyltransferase [Arthrobacter sp. RIT-PI-e]|uniref:GNAT family N-acetyltransferase n=1 Tax=Arthrobacter sp. RIT-PI-e TaxID=1681197 RepID=UPI0009E56DDA|nr:GNAT family N-acetyltransferase [Arthrobacter sp. RIT-PI-e]